MWNEIFGLIAFLIFLLIVRMILKGSILDFLHKEYHTSYPRNKKKID